MAIFKAVKKAAADASDNSKLVVPEIPTFDNTHSGLVCAAVGSAPFDKV